MPPIEPLSGKPSDVYAGIDGVWVTLRESNEVIRIVKPDTEPVPVSGTFDLRDRGRPEGGDQYRNPAEVRARESVE